MAEKYAALNEILTYSTSALRLVVAVSVVKSVGAAPCIIQNLAAVLLFEKDQPGLVVVGVIAIYVDWMFVTPFTPDDIIIFS